MGQSLGSFAGLFRALLGCRAPGPQSPGPSAALGPQASLWTELKDRQLSGKSMLQHDSTDGQFQNTRNTENCSQVRTYVEESLARNGKAAHQVHGHGYLWEGGEENSAGEELLRLCVLMKRKIKRRPSQLSGARAAGLRFWLSPWWGGLTGGCRRETLVPSSS